MNLIVSDFDGTFYDDNYLKNIEFIESIKDNYDFAIATGRNYNLLKKDLKTVCKYYICNDGGYILDENENIIYSNYINDKTIKIIYDRMKEMNYSDYFFDYIDHYDTNVKPNINKVSIKIRDNNSFNDMNIILSGLEGVYGYLSDNWMNILNMDSKKEKAIDKIIGNYDKVYVIGNEINDYGMIEKYNGYLITPNKNFSKTLNNFIELKKELL